MDDLQSSSASLPFQDQVILVWSERLKVAYVASYFSHAATETSKGLALPFRLPMGLGRTPAGTIATDGATDFYPCGNRIYIREEEK